jgi:hypothetical protein
MLNSPAVLRTPSWVWLWLLTTINVASQGSERPLLKPNIREQESGTVCEQLLASYHIFLCHSYRCSICLAKRCAKHDWTLVHPEWQRNIHEIYNTVWANKMSDFWVAILFNEKKNTILIVLYCIYFRITIFLRCNHTTVIGPISQQFPFATKLACETPCKYRRFGPCSIVTVYQRFGGTYCLHLQGATQKTSI